MYLNNLSISESNKNLQLPSTTQMKVYGTNLSDYIESEAKIKDEYISLIKDKNQDTDNETIDYNKELKNLGFYIKESSDEKLNNRNAVLRFQSEHNLLVDGIWGPESNNALKKRLENLEVKYFDTIKEPPTQGKWIAINKTKRILTFYEGSNVLRKYPIAVGNPPSLTPEGKFTIIVKVVNPAWGGGGYTDPIKGGIPENPLGYRWMGLSINGGGEYGIHGNNRPYSIGTNASHGCVRMINIDVEGLFNVVPKNTPVWIGTDKTLNEWGINQQSYSMF